MCCMYLRIPLLLFVLTCCRLSRLPHNLLACCSVPLRASPTDELLQIWGLHKGRTVVDTCSSFALSTETRVQHSAFKSLLHLVYPFVAMLVIWVVHHSCV